MIVSLFNFFSLAKTAAYVAVYLLHG